MGLNCCGTKDKTSATGSDEAAKGRPHNEEVCHGTEERRKALIEQLKICLNESDERPCEVSPGVTSADSAGPTKRLGQYEEYIRKHCQSWMPSNPRPPLITSVQTHEVRPTEDYNRMRANNNEYITYTDARHKPPPPTCDCAKRNGLQDRCENPGCKPPTPQCLASNPGPCCPPSMGLTGRAGQVPDTRHPRGTAAGEEHSQQTQTNTRSPQKAPPKAQNMSCFCKTEPDQLHTGQKYICCPATAFH